MYTEAQQRLCFSAEQRTSLMNDFSPVRPPSAPFASPSDGRECPICRLSSIGELRSDSKFRALGGSCLSGCFSKPPDVVVINGGRTPTPRRPCRSLASRLNGLPGLAHNPRLEGRTAPAMWFCGDQNLLSHSPASVQTQPIAVC
jgi:hypothetical protein